MKHLFKKGMKVRSTQEAIQWGVFKDIKNGKVCTYPARKDYNLVRVMLDGCKTLSTYSVKFWE